MYKYDSNYDGKDYCNDKHDEFEKVKYHCEEQETPRKDERKHSDKKCNCITINIIYNHAETGGQISDNGGQNANQDSVVVKKHDKKNKNAKVKKYV